MRPSPWVSEHWPPGSVSSFDLLKARGYAFHDPLFTLFFMVADFLPEVRLTARGVWDVRRRKVLAPSRPLRSG